MKPVVSIVASLLRYVDSMAKTHLTTFTAEMPKVIESVKTIRAEVIAAAFDLKVPEIGRSIGTTMEKAASIWDKSGKQLGCALNGSEFDQKAYDRKVALQAARDRKTEREWEATEAEAAAKAEKEKAEEVANEEKELAELLAEEKVVSIHS